MSKIKFPSKQDTENMKSIIEMLGDSVRRQCENRDDGDGTQLSRGRDPAR